MLDRESVSLFLKMDDDIGRIIKDLQKNETVYMKCKNYPMANEMMTMKWKMVSLKADVVDILHGVYERIRRHQIEEAQKLMQNRDY